MYSDFGLHSSFAPTMSAETGNTRDPLARLDRYKRRDQVVGSALGEEILQQYHQQIEKRQGKLATLADVWCRIVPPSLSDRCALESFHRGKLTVMVDTAAHLYELKQLMLAGLEAQLLLACRSAGLKKIVLKRGTWYDEQGRPRY